jgi:hypothetical protein
MSKAFGMWAFCVLETSLKIHSEELNAKLRKYTQAGPLRSRIRICFIRLRLRISPKLLMLLRFRLQRHRNDAAIIAVPARPHCEL